MNTETREVHIGYNMRNDSNAYKEYEAFGWKHTQDVRRGKSQHAILARDMDMPNYLRIADLDNQYFKLKSEKKYYTKMSFSTFVLLSFLFVIPGLIYWLFKYSQKRSIMLRNEILQNQMEDLVKQAIQLQQR